MNENLDLTQILKDCPKGTKLYSPIFGEVKFEEIDCSISSPVRVIDNAGQLDAFKKDGKYYGYKNAECMLFPSKDNRDWSTFKIEQPKPEPKFKPFDRVLVRDETNDIWQPHLYSRYNEEGKYRYICIQGYAYRCCIPYEGNEHLLGTTDEPKGKD